MTARLFNALPPVGLVEVVPVNREAFLVQPLNQGLVEGEGDAAKRIFNRPVKRAGVGVQAFGDSKEFSMPGVFGLRTLSESGD